MSGSHPPSFSSVRRAAFQQFDDGVWYFDRQDTRRDEIHWSGHPKLDVRTSKRQRRTHSLIRGAEARAIRFGPRDIYTGMVLVPQVDKMLAAEGLIEFDFWQMIGFAWPDIVEAFAQPSPLVIKVLGEKHTWIPDAFIRRGNGDSILVECKPLMWAQPDPETNPELAAYTPLVQRAMRTAAHSVGCQFHLMTENEVRMEPRFHNAKKMKRALAAQIPEPFVQAAFAVLECSPAEMIIAELAELLPAHTPYIVNLACVLDSRGIVRLDRRDFFDLKCRLHNLTCAASLRETSSIEGSERAAS